MKIGKINARSILLDWVQEPNHHLEQHYWS